MGAFFTSGVAYVFLTVFTLLSGIFFFFGVIGSGTTETSPMFSSMFIVVLFLIPILTMKLLSEEKKNRTDQGLLTAPVGLWSIDKDSKDWVRTATYKAWCDALSGK